MNTKSLLEYINSLNKEERDRFAAGCKTSIAYLRKAVSKKQELGADLCIAIERESGGMVVCESLRPDADWDYIRATAKREQEIAA